MAQYLKSIVHFRPYIDFHSRDITDSSYLILQTQAIENYHLVFYSPKTRRWSKLSQIFFSQGVDPTSLLRSEGVLMATQCNFHRLQFLVFTNNY